MHIQRYKNLLKLIIFVFRAGCRNAAHVPCGENAKWMMDMNSFAVTCSSCSWSAFPANKAMDL